MRPIPLAILLAWLGVADTARADFVITGTAPPTTPTQPTWQTEAPPAEAQRATRPATRPTPPRVPIAYGFGDSIPLSFAARQIVPTAVKVRYGPGADPSALVTWTGGQTWTRVLRAAVRPLGLHLVVSYGAVEIEK